MATSLRNRRPDPEALLLRLQSDQPDLRGKLKIFLGYCAGVGKTYCMLEAARREQSAGRTVLVGVVETHGRPETQALLEGLSVLPRLTLEHRGVMLEEFHLDECLRRKPDLVLVDELAHSNAPGSRHPKRHQDIEELLEAGIDVYTCLNIQHLESLNDVVLQITGVRVRETVPDQVLQRASSIELIDLPGEELLGRLREGKVYLGPKANRAAENFFRPGNLVALRELALRSAANRIDEEVLRYMRKRSIAGPWPVRERLLVAVGPSPLSERLIRAAKRLAESLSAEWLAISVEGTEPYTPDARERVAAHLRLATSLGAHTEHISGTSIPARLIEYAREHNVTQIVAGKPLRSGFWRFTPDLVDQLIALSGEIDIYVISADVAPGRPPQMPITSPRSAYFWSTLSVLLLTVLVCMPVSRVLAPTNLVMAYLAVVCGVAFYLGRGPAFWASALSVAIFDFVFVPPYYTFAVSDGQYLLTFGALLLVSFIISTLTGRAREQAASARTREGQALALLDLSRDLSSARSSEDLRRTVESHLRKRLDEEAQVHLEVPRQLESSLLGVADWAWQHARKAGLHTDTLPQAPVTCVPVLTGEPPQSAALVLLRRSAPLLRPEQELLDAFLLQTSVALERLQLAKMAQKTEVLEATDKLQTALLNSVSHDLRIPLVSIMGALQAIHDEDSNPLESEVRINLVDNALVEARRLNRIVGNLLQMSQLESGVLKVQLQPQEVSDILAGIPVAAQLPDHLPLVACDILLTQQVLLNLLDNARKYAPQHPPRLVVWEREDGVVFSLEDEGPGIPESERVRVFERFYRAKNSPSESGTGLGLSICQGLVEAQGGRIWVEPSAKGCRIQFSLPKEVA